MCSFLRGLCQMSEWVIQSPSELVSLEHCQLIHPLSSSTRRHPAEGRLFFFFPVQNFFNIWNWSNIGDFYCFLRGKKTKQKKIHKIKLFFFTWPPECRPCVWSKAVFSVWFFPMRDLMEQMLPFHSLFTESCCSAATPWFDSGLRPLPAYRRESDVAVALKKKGEGGETERRRNCSNGPISSKLPTGLQRCRDLQNKTSETFTYDHS